MNTRLTETAAHSSPLNQHVAAFDTFERETSKHAPPWLRALRTSGISYFADLGFPGPKEEEYRFLNLNPITGFPFSGRLQKGLTTANAPMLELFNFGGMDAHRLVFVDGNLCPELSSPVSESSGLTVNSLEAAIQRHGGFVEKHLGRYSRHERNAFAALNTAFIHDGAFIHVHGKHAAHKPVHLLFIATTPNQVIHPRTLVVADTGTQVRIVEDYVGLPGLVYWNNAVTEIVAGASAQVEHAKLQRESDAAYHVATIEAHQGRDSRVISHSISLGARIARNDINLRFQGEGCESILNGLYLAAGEQVVDHHTIADHMAPHCASHEFYHGILGGRARGVFNGKIYVRSGAQKTNAKQTNKNLLLSPEATINTKPQLEILADDVKCTHGATVGQLDETAIFYLRSRGIGEELARQILVRAFASDVLNRIQIEPVRQELEKTLTERLAS